ncbi:Protein of uncharacterised function (DUF1043) [Mannheimia haemolytica]|nr:Protein of uncharacterised function (DUF1043) [Mannheimia haemolytica]
MEQWTTDVWAAIMAAFIVGAVIGCTLVRVFNSSVRKQHELEKELKQTKLKWMSKNKNLNNTLSNQPNYFQV